jgi:hypothetical protein
MGGGKGGGSGRALAAQVNLAREGLAQQEKQFNYIRDLMSPFVLGGTESFNQIGNLIGTGGAEAQQSALDALQSSPYFSGLVQQGENALLQNASATGGLRGGNTQAALAQFRPQMLQQAVQQQLANLSGMTEYGLGAAGNITGASNQYSGAIGQAYGNMANAFAQRAQQKAQGGSGLGGMIGQGLGLAAGLGWQPFG